MLNKAQSETVMSDAGKLLVLAGAGTGKTTTMLARISHLVNDEDIDPKQILVLTFTNAAAVEMRDRYRRNDIKESPVFCTFHGFCYSLIAGDLAVAGRIGYSRGVPDIADDVSLRKIKTACRQKCGIKISDDKINGVVPVTKKEEFEKTLYRKAYNKMLKEQNLITFDIMCNDVCKLFVVNDPVIMRYKERYRYIFVDEFQDTDPKQWDFVSSFKESSLFVCGDAKQSIYSFRGADSSVIKSLADNSGWAVIKLDENYRCTSQICEYANKIHKDLQDKAYNLDIHSTKHGCEVTIKKGNIFDYEEDIQNISDEQNKGKTVAILSRTNFEADSIKQKLDLLGIRYSSRNEKGEVSGILKCSVDSEFLVDYLSDKLNSKQYNEFIKLCAIDPSYKDEDRFLSVYGKYLAGYLGYIEKIREITGSEHTVKDKIIMLCNLLGFDFPDDIPEICDTKDIIDFLIDLSESSHNISDIYVGTVHSVKGLEYDNVYVTGVNGKSFDISLNEEQKNLFYVACTRAKEKLVIYDFNSEDR